MKHQIGELGGNILVHTNSMDITMAWRTSCKDVATRVGSFALHIIFCLGLRGATAPATPSTPQMTPLPVVGFISLYFTRPHIPETETKHWNNLKQF